jgi:hypothetical protein
MMATTMVVMMSMMIMMFIDDLCNGSHCGRPSASELMLILAAQVIVPTCRSVLSGLGDDDLNQLAILSMVMIMIMIITIILIIIMMMVMTMVNLILDYDSAFTGDCPNMPERPVGPGG